MIDQLVGYREAATRARARRVAAQGRHQAMTKARVAAERTNAAWEAALAVASAAYGIEKWVLRTYVDGLAAGGTGGELFDL